MFWARQGLQEGLSRNVQECTGSAQTVEGNGTYVYASAFPMPHTRPHHQIEEPLCAKETARLLGYRYHGFMRALRDGKIPLRCWRNVEHGRYHFDRLEVLLYIERKKVEGLKPTGRISGIRIV